jgi:integrase
MSRRPKGPRLYFRKARTDRAGVYVILDGGREFATGCGDGELGRAQDALALHLAHARVRPQSPGDPAQVSIADCLTLYIERRAEHLARADIVLSLAPMLLAHAGDAPVSAITKTWCQAYVTARTTGRIKPPEPKHGNALRRPQAASVARDLEVLSAALGFAVEEGLLAMRPAIWKPKGAPPRVGYLTRDQAAHLLWTCWRGRYTSGKGAVRHPWRHLCRFILMGVYTGTRPGTITRASFAAASGRSYIDLQRRMFHRLPDREAESDTKRRTTAILPDRLAAHMERWARDAAGGWLITHDGKPVASVKKALAAAVKAAGLGGKGITPHILRHTFMTWQVSNGRSLQDAARDAGMSIKVAERTYAHLDTSRREGLNNAIYGRNAGGASRRWA